MDNILEVSYEVKHALTMWPSHSIYRYLPKWNENMSVHRGVYFICGSKKLETNQISINKWMNKQMMVHPFNGLLLNNKKEWSIDSHDMNEGENIMLREGRQKKNANGMISCT